MVKVTNSAGVGKAQSANKEMLELVGDNGAKAAAFVPKRYKFE